MPGGANILHTALHIGHHETVQFRTFESVSVTENIHSLVGFLSGSVSIPSVTEPKERFVFSSTLFFVLTDDN